MHLASADPLSGLSVDSPAFRERAPHRWLPEDPDSATIETVREMVRQINAASRDPVVQQAAYEAQQSYSGSVQDRVFWWVKNRLRFVHHGKMFDAWAGELGDPSTKLQLLISPDVLLRMDDPHGDCAIYTMLVCALLRASGLHYQVMTIACDWEQPEVFSHVCARVALANGNTVTLDTSHGAYPGWQVPENEVSRVWVFDELGQRVTGRGFRGLHDYRGRRGLRGIVCDDAGCYDDAGGSSDDFGPLCPPGMIQSGQSCISTGGSSGGDWGGGWTAPSQNSGQWADFAAKLAQMGFTLAQIKDIQPGTVVGPNGQILRQNPGYAVPAGTSASLNVGSSSNILLYGGLAIAAILAASMLKGGR